MRVNSYKELTVWQKSVDLIKKVYKLAEQLPKSEEFNLKQQLKRAVVSVALNIAEGKSRRTAKDFAHFLNLSAASLAEVEATLVICGELGYLHDIDYLYNDTDALGKMLNALRNSLVKDRHE